MQMQPGMEDCASHGMKLFEATMPQMNMMPQGQC
jgi:hypothetical protein